jgi:hypothetical protein
MVHGWLEALISQSADGSYIQTYCSVLLLHSAGEQVGTIHIDYLAEALVGFREEGGLEYSRFILKGDKLHGITFVGNYFLSGDGPGRHGYHPPNVSVKLIRWYDSSSTSTNLPAIEPQRVN